MPAPGDLADRRLIGRARCALRRAVRTSDWTPAHKAAASDDYATPLEEARNLGKLAAVEHLESIRA